MLHGASDFTTVDNFTDPLAVKEAFPGEIINVCHIHMRVVSMRSIINSIITVFAWPYFWSLPRVSLSAIQNSNTVSQACKMDLMHGGGGGGDFKYQ